MTDWIYVLVVFIATITLCVCLKFQDRRIKAMIDSDKEYEKSTDKNGVKEIQKGHSRSSQDYSSIPFLQRMGMKVDPKLILAERCWGFSSKNSLDCAMRSLRKSLVLFLPNGPFFCRRYRYNCHTARSTALGGV